MFVQGCTTKCAIFTIVLGQAVLAAIVVADSINPFTVVSSPLCILWYDTWSSWHLAPKCILRTTRELGVVCTKGLVLLMHGAQERDSMHPRLQLGAPKLQCTSVALTTVL